MNHYISICGYFLKNFKNFHRFIEELYARLYHWYVRSIKFVSILKRPALKGLKLDKYIVFFLSFGASLKVTSNPLKKRIPFCRSIYVTKVMKLLAFIFEQPSYNSKQI